MSSEAELNLTIEALKRMRRSVELDGDIDVDHFEELIQSIYKCSKHLTPQTAQAAKNAIDHIGYEIRKHLRRLLVEGQNFPTIKKALSMYNSFHHSSPPIVGFNRNV